MTNLNVKCQTNGIIHIDNNVQEKSDKKKQLTKVIVNFDFVVVVLI